MYVDTPLIRVSHVPGRSEQLDAKTVLIRPNGKATGQILVPAELQDNLVDPCTRSRWARCGLHVGPHGSTRANAQGVISVSLYNWSPEYGLIIEEGDAIALVPDQWLKNLPVAKKIPLLAGTTLLRMKKELLPQIDGLPYFNPYKMDKHDYMEEVEYGALELKEYDFVVVQAAEHEPVPDRYTGIITSAVGRLLHNSARYVHGGSSGHLALEYKVFEPTMLKPGKPIAKLAIYKTPGLPPYTGALGRQNSLIPAIGH